jgi:hypothetical protein
VLDPVVDVSFDKHWGRECQGNRGAPSLWLLWPCRVLFFLSGHRVSADIILHFGPPAAILLAPESTKNFHFVDMPPGAILLTPLSAKLDCQRRRPWQRTDVTRRGLPCAAAFACTDYKVQGRTLESVLSSPRTTSQFSIIWANSFLEWLDSLSALWHRPDYGLLASSGWQ